MKRVLPLVCAVNQKMGSSVDAVSTPHSNGMQYALVETEHPYKAPGVNLFNVSYNISAICTQHTHTHTHTHTQSTFPYGRSSLLMKFSG